MSEEEYNVQLQQENKQLKENYQFELEENAKLSDLWCKSQQENKQLKEDFKILKTLQMNTNNILNELEEWLCGEKIVVYNVDGKVGILRGDILYKIQELKKKFGDKNE